MLALQPTMGFRLVGHFLPFLPFLTQFLDVISYYLFHIFFFFLCWRYNPLWVLAFSAMFFHSVLSLLSFLHPLIPIVWISSSTSSIHLFLGLPQILLPTGFHSNILLGILPPSIRVTCPSQAILLLFINITMSAFPTSSFSSWFFLILQITFSSCTGPIYFFFLLFTSTFSATLRREVTLPRKRLFRNAVTPQ